MIRFLIKIGYLEGKLHARKRIRAEIRADYLTAVYKGIFDDGEHGYVLNCTGRMKA